MMITYIQSLEPDFYIFIAVSNMPNHVLLLIQQKQELRIIMQKIKSSTAQHFNSINCFQEKEFSGKSLILIKQFEMKSILIPFIDILKTMLTKQI